MDLKALAASLLGAVNGTPTFGANVNDNATNGAETANIRALGALNARGDVGAQAVQAVGTGANERASQDEMARKIAEQAAADEEERKAKELKRLQDPNEYKAIINKVGGYDFFDPTGGKISAVEYARKKNMQLTDVYKKSQDPNDKDFLDDYKTVTELGKAIQSGDAKARDKIYAKNPEFKKAYHTWKYNDIVADLHKTYPGYFRSDAEGRSDIVGNMKGSRIPEEEEEDTRSKFKKNVDKLVPSIFGIGNTSTYEVQKTKAKKKKK